MFGILRDLFRYIHAQRKYWLMPIVAMMVLLGGIVVLSKGSVIAPFVYALF
jgi:hypothetical protein